MTPKTQDKLNALKRHLRDLGSAVVAYSGGVDSTFLAVVAHEALGDRMAAVMGISPSLARRELEDAVSVARRFGLPLERVETKEMENPLYVANNPDRCFHCKDDLFGRLGEWSRERGYSCVLDGTNADDLGDVRPGREAARRHGVGSPLMEMAWSKEEIREASRDMGIPIWDKPATPCLASRVPHGEPVQVDALRRVESAESAVRDLGFRDVRVRAHGDLARIELPVDEIPRLMENRLRERVLEGVRKSGFERVTLDLAGYRPSGLQGDPNGTARSQPSVEGGPRGG